MARRARLSLPHTPHLLWQRAQPSRQLFLDDEDRARYLADLREAARVNQVHIHAYGLTDVEVWLMATPQHEEGLARMVQTLGRRYVVWHNRRHGLRGSPWDGRYRSCPIQPGEPFIQCQCLIEDLGAQWTQGHPTEAVAASAWSSAAHHLGLRHDSLLSPHASQWALGNTPFERETAYRAILTQGLAASARQRIQAHLRSGLPLGDAAFRQQLERTLGCSLGARPRGRPPKDPSKVERS